MKKEDINIIIEDMAKVSRVYKWDISTLAELQYRLFGENSKLIDKMIESDSG